MGACSREFQIESQGNNDVLNITENVARCVADTELTCAVATVFVIGSTAAITTTEYEPGLADHDLRAAFEGIAPEHGRYRHEETWHDDNGHSHVRATLVGPSLSIPVVGGDLQLGTWQQIILIDFDTRPRSRRVLVQVIGD